MRILFLLLLIGCSDDAVILDAQTETCTITPGNTCEAAHELAQAYCGRLETCFSVANDMCQDNVIKDICRDFDCTATYQNKARLDECISWYNAQPCDGPRPPMCKLY